MLKAREFLCEVRKKTEVFVNFVNTICLMIGKIRRIRKKQCQVQVNKLKIRASVQLLYTWNEVSDLLRERYKVRKKKKMQKILHLGFETPPPNAEKYNLFFLSFWHHSEQLWKNSFFPLEKVQKKNQNIFRKLVLRGGLTPLTKGKIFLCISGRIGPFYTL